MSPTDIILSTPLGPITVESLNQLEGWRWDLDILGHPGEELTLVAGETRILREYTDETGWIFVIQMFARAPAVQLGFKADDWFLRISPLAANTLGITAPNNSTLWNSVYNPFTVIGPMYGINFTPSLPYPYYRRFVVDVTLPAVAGLATADIYVVTIGRIYIVDERTFLRSIKRLNIEQLTGRRMERYP